MNNSPLLDNLRAVNPNAPQLKSQTAQAQSSNRYTTSSNPSQTQTQKVVVNVSSNAKSTRTIQVSVGFGTALCKFFSNFLNFSGRSSRSEFIWIWLLGDVVISIIAWAIVGIGMALSTWRNETPLIIAICLIAFPGIAYTIGRLALSVRRLHDADHSGACILLSFIPFIGPIILLVFLLQPSHPIKNAYGEVPNLIEV